MAVSDNSGKISGFTIKDRELQEKIDTYKARTESGEILLPSWPDFCSFLGIGDDILEEVMERGLAKKEDGESAYYGRAVMLKNMGHWCEAQLVSNPNWGGKMAVKAMFLLKQGFGRSRKYVDEKSGKKEAVKVELSFGGSDPRAKKASK